MRAKSLANCLFLLFILLFPATLSAAENADALYEKARKPYYSLRAQPLEKQTREKWIEVANQFEPVLQAQPVHPHHPKALYTIGKIYQHLFDRFNKREDADKALEYFHAIPSRFPKNNLADDALLAYIQVSLVISDGGKARWALEQLARHHPHSNLIATAKESFKVFEPIIIEKPEKKIYYSLAVKPDSLSWLNLLLPAQLQKISHKSDKERTEITVTFSAQVNVKHFYIPASGDRKDRLVFDFSPVTISKNIRGDHTIKDKRALRMRTALFDKDVSRIVFDLETSKVVYAVTREKNPFRVVITIADENAITEEAPAAPILAAMNAPAPPANEEVTPPTKEAISPPNASESNSHKNGTYSEGGLNSLIEKTAASQSKKPDPPPAKAEEKTELAMVAPKLQPVTPPREEKLLPAMQIRTIAIDPGHGGYDTGAIGPGGTREKDITLQIAKVLAKKIEKELKLKVVLTRDSDKFIELADRMTIATEAGADLFISIHCNANKNRKTMGLSTYYLNDTNDVAAKRIAARENNMSIKDMSNLGRILLDLSIKSNTDDSANLAELVNVGMVNSVRNKYPDTRDLGVRNAIFMVLLETRIPAVLVEAAFISNHTEEKRLRTKEYQGLIAEGIVNGIREYVKKRKHTVTSM